MKDPFFEGTVILLCQYDAEGALGLVLNRECPISVGEVLEQTKLPSIKDGTKKTLWGGPVGGGACFVLWKGTPPADQGWIINADQSKHQELGWVFGRDVGRALAPTHTCDCDGRCTHACLAFKAS